MKYLPGDRVRKIYGAHRGETVTITRDDGGNAVSLRYDNGHTDYSPREYLGELDLDGKYDID
jgi:hypothetical protein